MVQQTIRSSLCALLVALCGSQGAHAGSCAADLNGDSTVNGVDLAVVLEAWGPCPSGATCVADLDGDAQVGGLDLTALLAAWGPCKTPTRFVGTVIRDNGSGVADAVVVTGVGGTTSTDAYGDFQLDVGLPTGTTSVTVTAVTTVYGITYQGSRNIEDVAAGGVYELDPIMVVPTDTECAGEYDWIPTFGGAAGMSGPVWAMAAYDDGSGPALYAAGNFMFAGSQLARGLAKWDGESWNPLGVVVTQGPQSRVRALCVFDDGGGPALFVGGWFNIDGTWRAIARWDGVAWSGVGVVTGEWVNDAVVAALAVYDDGTGPALYAGGALTSAGGTPTLGIAKWDGTAWSALGGGISEGVVLALQVYDDGSGSALYAGGFFESAGGVPASNIAKWNGSSWSTVGGGVAGKYGQVLALQVYDDGSGSALYVGGWFTASGGTPASNIAKWDGVGWSPLASGTSSAVSALAVHDDGGGPKLCVGGWFTSAGGVPVGRFASWDGATWSPLGVGISDGGVRCMMSFDDGSGRALFAGRSPNNNVLADHIARWDGTSWTAVGRGVNGFVGGMATFDDGAGPSLFVTSAATSPGGGPIGYAHKWDGTSWSILGGGLNGEAGSAVVFDDGTGPALYVGGRFTSADGVPASRIARWDGTSWSALGSGIQGVNMQPYWVAVLALTVYDDGRGPALYVAGDFDTAGGVPASNVARWDGKTWSAVGGGVDGGVHAMAVYDDGSGPCLYVGGFMGNAGGVPALYIAKWNGKSWSGLGSGIANTESNPWVRVLAVHDDGSGPALYAGGHFTRAGGVTARHIARWDGSEWSAVGSGMGGEVESLVSYNPGSGPVLIAGGWFGTAGGLPASRIARWDGTAWSPMGAGFNATIGELTVFNDGNGPAVYASGQFWSSPAGDSFIAKWGCVEP